jgi:hypothetical protein
MTETTAAAPPLAPLTADEQNLLGKLLARASADKTPATRIGSPYEALICLSVPRRGDKDRQTDLVMPGETVYLTDEEARWFERHGNRDGRQVAVIRRLSGPESTSEPAPRLLPRHVSGRLFRPAVPPPGSDAPRPDPQGSSSIQVVDDGGRAPEADGASTAEPSEMEAHLTAAPVVADAVDLPPTRGRGRPRQG